MPKILVAIMGGLYYGTVAPLTNTMIRFALYKNQRYLLEI
jgi:hypothetical protein